VGVALSSTAIVFCRDSLPSVSVAMICPIFDLGPFDLPGIPVLSGGGELFV
jgi:hypothetical protein